MDEALEQMQLRQAEANDQMRMFIDQMKESVAKGQSESAELTMGMMKELSESSSALIKGLQSQAYSDQEAHEHRQASIARQTTDLLDQQGEHLAGLTAAVKDAAQVMQETVERLQLATTTNVERMGLGAERLLSSSTRLSDNLDVMKSASDGLGGMAEKLNASASTLSSALSATQQVLNDQRNVRDALGTMVSDLKSTIENAKHEASLTTELVASLQTASQRLSAAQTAADSYLAGVTQVLGEAHSAFAKQMEITMREGNRQFHEELAAATGLLKGAIQDLGDVLDNLPTSA
jgi:ABC-type transporter Mla subunit MlaD